MVKYNHAFEVAFEVETEHTGEEVTAEELLAGITERVRDLRQECEADIVEACGLPYDTYEIE
jgi:hypothetical protein